jgi:cytochrome oxidase assembly protein ShyY1
VTPAALPQDIPNNHFVYALTWLGLAGVLAWIWAGYVISRRQAP